MADATGWSVDYILHHVNYQTLIMMMSDAPRYASPKKAGRASCATAEEEAAQVAGLFASELKR